MNSNKIENPDTISYESCPLCFSINFVCRYTVDITTHRAFKSHFHSKGYWMRCGTCGHEFRDGIWIPTRLEEIYAVDDPSQSLHFDIRRRQSADIIESVKKYKSAGTWLDVGFGDGSLLITAQEYGYDCFGLDYRQGNISHLKNIGIEAFDYDFLSLEVKEKFDVISMCDLIEHIGYPRDYIRKAHDLLNISGVLMISCPNRQSKAWDFYVRNNNNPYMKELEHYHNFGREGLIQFVAENGFEYLQYSANSRYKFGMDLLFCKP